MRPYDVTGRLLPSRHGHLSPVVLLTGLGLAGLLVAGCSTPAGTTQSGTTAAELAQIGKPVEVAEAGLRDKKTTEQDGQTSWTTTWRVCFRSDQVDSTRLEAQAVTTEGSGTSLRALKENCLELDIARGQNEADAGMRGRDAQLADAAALSYRVRAVHHDGTVTPWTEPITAGTTQP